MSRRWLLSLLCLSVLIVLLAPLTRARGELKLNEALTRFLINKESPEALLAIENSTGETLNAKVEVEILDPLDRIISQSSGVQMIGAGKQTLTVALPHYLSKLKPEARRDVLWHRLHYRLSVEGQPGVLSEGIISLSEITPDMFELRVAAGGIAREGTRYRARVLASHPVTRNPAPNVLIDAELTLEDDNNITLRNSKLTDADGYAVFDFQMPNRFPQFPHKLRPSGGELHVVGRRGALVAEAQGSTLVDQFTKTLVTTDKSLYQPGQVMHFRALIFTASRRALADQNIRFRVKDPEETEVFRTVAKTSRFGIASADWTIPEKVRLGDYQILVAVDGNNDEGEESSERIYTIRISRYDLPNFSVKVQTDRDYYLPRQNAEVRVRADYLFGQPVRRGHVRVIRETQREWNYREQKWDVVEGDKHEGDTDANGEFVVRLDLSREHADLRESTWRRFDDITYAAYFKDPTTNRTEQRRFDLRVTRDPIHIYVVTDYYRNRTMPLRFYVTASYADGTPARCKIDVALSNDSEDSRRKQPVITREVVSLRTNRYGVAKANGIRVPTALEKETDLTWVFSATDSTGRSGKRSESLHLDTDPKTLVDTDKALYRAGEPIVASVISSVPDETLVVDLLRDANVIRSERLRLRNGHGSITFAYTPEFKDRLTIAAYPDFPESNYMIDTRTVLYPQNKELQLNARTAQTTYRPGDNAHVTFNVRAPEGRGTESALGVVVIDKAVEERFRTEKEFGGSYSYTAEDSLKNFLELDQQLGGVTLRDLQRLNTATLIAPDLDLVAEVLLNQSRDYWPNFFGGDEYDSEQPEVFKKLIEKQLAPVKEALAKRYLATNQYPKSDASLQSLLAEDKIDFSRLLDPWGTPYEAMFSVERADDVLTLKTAGADKRFGTDDDFFPERLRWPYFSTIGATIDRVIRQYHERTGGFIRDLNTLREELSKAGIAVDQLRDPWGQPYRFLFTINQTNFVLVISSSGYNKMFSQDPVYRADDFDIWISAIDYFAEPRARIERILAENLKTTRMFPQSEQELRDILPASIYSLRDPWGRPYYAIFRTEMLYADRTQVDNQIKVGDTPETRTTITPVTRKVALVGLRSIGPDGRSGTRDDFSVADFRGVMSEQTRGGSEPQAPAAQVVLSGSNGAIWGQVTDGPGASISQVKVTATLVLQEKSYETSTDDLGKYLISNLPPGLYKLQFNAPGFKSAIISDVMLQAGGVVQVNAIMEPGALTETVSITASGGPESFSTRSVNAGRSTVDKSRSIITKSGSSQITTPRLREYFPETLFWQPSVETDKEGRAQIDFKLADNITTWKLAIVGSTEDGLVGTTETEIKSFQPFFVEHDPPRILTQGDEISLPIVVRNYLPRPQKVDLEVKPEGWFSLLGPARKRTAVAAGDASRETFDFRAVASIKDGKQRITATAVERNDAIEKPITVHPDGEELSVTDSDILGSSATLQLNLPEKMIPSSHEAELKIYPNLMAHVIESVEAIMSRPYGCGEQVISAAYPSLLLLRQHKSSGDDSALRARAERYLSLGYSSLLNYRDDNGAFTYWGRDGADVALTAYALRFLTDANGLVAVDKDVTESAQEWLIEKQQKDGSWRAVDYWSSQENLRRTALLTAYVTRALTMTEDGEKKPEALKRAMDYLSRRAAEIDEPYLLASYALAALNLRDTSRAKPIIEKLVTLVHKEGGTNYWALETNTPFYGWGIAGRVETTALVIQALRRYCSVDASQCTFDTRLINGALLFLLKQKDRYGVWYSTQATINVLEAMLSILSTQSTVLGASEAQAEILVNEQHVQAIKLPAAANQLVTPITVDISKFLQTGKNAVRIRRPEGSPFASVQALASFYQPWTTSESGVKTETRANDLRLLTKCDRTQGKIGDEITCHVEAERIAFKGYGMMLAEIGVPPGADVDRASLETAMNGSGWVINQYDVLPDRIVVYLWPQAGGAKFNFKFRPRFGLNAKSAASVLYDYYNPEARTVVPPATFSVRDK